MTDSGAALRHPRLRAAAGIAAVALGMVLFGVHAHQRLPWFAAGVAGLLLAAAGIAWSGFGGHDPRRVMGLGRLRIRAALVTGLGIVIGAAAGLRHRGDLGMTLPPEGGVEMFVIVACVIGAMEELVFRGWMIGRAHVLGWPAAILLSALSHAAYKTALFAGPAVPVRIDLPSMMLVTAIGGIVLGLLRLVSGSLIPPLLAHVAFDFVVYRSVGAAPWWVWN